MTKHLLLTFALTITGCASLASMFETRVLSVTPEQADIQAASTMLEPGDGTIRGSALLRQRGGGVVTCAGNEVFLIPATESVSRQLEGIFGGEQGYIDHGGHTTLGGGTVVSPAEPYRETICDAQGSFRFTDVQPGRWHVMTTVIWEVADEYQGGTLLGTTEVANGREAELVLTQ